MTNETTIVNNAPEYFVKLSKLVLDYNKTNDKKVWVFSRKSTLVNPRFLSFFFFIFFTLLRIGFSKSRNFSKFETFLEFSRWWNRQCSLEKRRREEISISSFKIRVSRVWKLGFDSSRLYFFALCPPLFYFFFFSFSFSPNRILNNYLVWQTVRTLTACLSKPFRDAYKGLRKALIGSEGREEQWRYCVSDTHNVMGFAIGAMFVREVFHGKSKPMVNSHSIFFNDNRCTCS